MSSDTHLEEARTQKMTLVRLHAEDQWVPLPSEALRGSTIDAKISRLVCDNCWGTVFSFHAFQSTWLSHKSKSISGAKGCEWCRIVCEAIENKLKTPVKLRNDTTRERFCPSSSLRIIVAFGLNCGEDPNLLALLLEVRDINLSQAFEVYTTDDDNAGRFLTNRDVPREMDCSLTYAHTRRQLEECFRHESCPPPVPAALPTRLLDCTDPTQPRLFVSNGTEKELYAALSYVWGEDQPQKTTSQNIDSYTISIDMWRIPQTIRDAITVTHNLGVRYLWVDAFCIMQDSREDKAREIAKMRAIFRNAYFTIVASSAKCVSEGFLHPRDPKPSAILPFLCPDRTIGTMSLSVPQPELLNAPAPPETRAWCLEERLLSPRLLLYSSHTLEYECQTIHVNIDGSRRYLSNPAISRLPDHVFSTELAHVNTELRRNSNALRTQYNVWRAILEEYTARSLTKSRDRLNALAGVAEHFQWPGSRYLAGLWSVELPWGLLWHIDAPPRKRPTKYRAPSWSWAAIDGKIAGYNPYEYERLFTLTSIVGLGSPPICLVEVCEVTNLNPSYHFGGVTGGYLTVTTVTMKVFWAKGSNLYEHDRVEGAKEVIGRIQPDALEDCSNDILLAFICKHKRNHVAGIALVAIGSEHPAYKTDTVHYHRIGHCEVTSSVYERGTSERATITIV
ncbi:het domain protein [Moniliophthora roreri MCA 2997]|uniref:Het domain protein n=1 Tax=Moniliophthora roreri (strain MCA 2997) TaxID=1381753 RepID=V2W673_MONRO|nr:het domain protein [Moniliophthora roreri MCA 2997]